MAVDYDADTQLLDQTTIISTPVTFSHTSAGTNRAIIFAIMANDHGVTQVNWTSVTAGGTTMDAIGNTAFNSAGAPRAHVWVWGLANQGSGAITMSATPDQILTAVDLSAISFTGADQTGGTTTFNGYVGQAGPTSGATTSANVTSGSTNDMVLDVTESTENDHSSLGAGQTSRWEDNSGSTNTSGSTKAGAAGTVAISDTWTAAGGANSQNVIGLNITAADGGGASTDPGRPFTRGIGRGIWR